MTPNKPIFVISDLHMGNGSRLDQFRRSGAKPLLLRFLDYVIDQQGTLIIVGDLLELWRFSLREVIDHRYRLLDKFSEIETVYIPGNHDTLAIKARETRVHPLFRYVRPPFTVCIGNRRFHFMHGHELDPFIFQHLYNRTLPGCVSPAFVLKDNVCRWKDNVIPGLILEGAEYLIGILHGLSGNPLHQLHPELYRQANQRKLGYPIRVQKMLSRYHHDKDRMSYDVAVVGHSHQAGRYGNWYFNSGCWIGSTHGFLKIWPDGHVDVLSWDERGATPNQTIVWNHPTKMN
jgi:UDP-2,3-diacylglucosamine pyrophosphatase LpxH